MLNYLKRFQNAGSLFSLASLVGLLLIQFGFTLDQTWYINTVKLVLSILVVLGICNNPTTSGLDLPVINKENE